MADKKSKKNATTRALREIAAKFEQQLRRGGKLLQEQSRGTEGSCARLYRLIWDGFIKGGGEQGTPRVHPTQKPISLMKWCLGFYPKAQKIVDPYAGSGTTLVAAKDLGIPAIGIEIEEKYCEISAKRLSQEVLNLEAGVQP